ncbi:MAG: SPOR domain-containing protein [Acidobacteriota bacterium]
MDEPRTHYQLSFTARQALLLFVGLLGALAVAYFFGLMTGLAGREAPVTTEVGAIAMTPTAAPPPASVPTAETLEVPKAVRGISPPRAASRTTLGAPAAAAAAASPTPSLQLFEDAPASEPPRAARAVPTERAPRTRTPAHATEPAAGSFWVQALSASSESEALSRRERLAAHGFPSAVVPGPGPHGRVYRVRVGPFRTRPEAEHAAALLKTREKLEPWIVPPGK